MEVARDPTGESRLRMRFHLNCRTLADLRGPFSPTGVAWAWEESLRGSAAGRPAGVCRKLEQFEGHEPRNQRPAAAVFEVLSVFLAEIGLQEMKFMCDPRA
jgi:hypothetical protein